MPVLMGARSGLMPMFELKCVQCTYFHLKYRHQFMYLYEYIYVVPMFMLMTSARVYTACSVQDVSSRGRKLDAWHFTCVPDT